MITFDYEWGGCVLANDLHSSWTHLDENIKVETKLWIWWENPHREKPGFVGK